MKQVSKKGKILSFYAIVITLFLLGTFIGNKTVAVIAESIPVPRLHTIVIDPGHGGEDGGAISCTGKEESQFNLEISLRLDDICHLLGLSTVLTRETDTAIYTTGETITQKKISDLKERVRISNTIPDAVLVSIHQNYFSEPQYAGAQVFYGKNKESQEVAEQLQAAIIEHLNPGSNRAIKRGEGIYILEKTTIPSVLVECGFLSNKTEAQKLSSAEYQIQLSSVIGAALACHCAEA